MGITFVIIFPSRVPQQRVRPRHRPAIRPTHIRRMEPRQRPRGRYSHTLRQPTRDARPVLVATTTSAAQRDGTAPGDCRAVAADRNRGEAPARRLGQARASRRQLNDARRGRQRHEGRSLCRLLGHAKPGSAIRARVLSRSCTSDQKVSAISAGSIAFGVAVAVPLTDPAIVTSPT